MARKPTPKPADTGEVEIECTCDRLPLDSGEVLINGQRGTVPASHAENYIAAEKAARV